MSQAVGHLVSQATTLGLTLLPASFPPPPSLFFPQMWQTHVLDSLPPVSSLLQTCQTEDLLPELKVRGREPGELSREERAMTFLSSRQRGDVTALDFFLKWHQQPIAQASPGDWPHHPCLPVPLKVPSNLSLSLVPMATVSPSSGSPPCSLCQPSQASISAAAPIRDFSFSYKTLDKIFAWLKIKRREASCPPLHPLRDAVHWLP